jgi:oxygen-independent coproporphyrinogen-3 oxidase
MEASLYIHVPFCAGKCDYCDFYSVPLKLSTFGSLTFGSSDGRPEFFVNTLLAEAETLFKKYPVDNVPTIFIGGGTPSVLGPTLMRRLLKGILSLIGRFSPPPLEVTVEANPESADEDFLAAIREEGATRLSLGVQTFYAPSRKAVHRAGDEAVLPGRLALVSAFFTGAFSVDLISGLPFQSKSVLLDDIAKVASYKPAHISLYALSGKKAESLGLDEADELWLCGRDALEKSGYFQYEVSNFCLPGGECKHNMRYWRMQNWLALGPAASGTIIDDATGTGFRYTFPPDADNWLESVNERLDAFTLIKETFLMGFRYAEGPDEASFLRRFKKNVQDVIPKTLDAWRGRGLLCRDKRALTKEGLLFLNRFLLEVFEELDLSFPKC